ncbi:MAG: flippase-like domain-containing protein [Candidatus Parcubacteria bacterium]|nr:flippase-like domain-containing protein [Leptolyngbyaceae cyanobacterium LF-bin-113]
MQAVRSRLKASLRWLILGLVLFFLAKTLKDHWQEVAAIRVDAVGYAGLTIALGVTLLAHIFAGWVWSWILQLLNQPVTAAWSVKIYLQTNLAKYLPGNIWHFYGRISAAAKTGIPTEIAIVSVLLEPLLMVVAALLITLIGVQQIAALYGWVAQILVVVALVAVLAIVHPRFLNPLIGYLAKLKQKASGSSQAITVPMKRYPIQPLLGELGFLGLRGIGFILTFGAIVPLSPDQFPAVMGAFALAWLTGFVIPGLPGGIGVFEAVAIALLSQGSAFLGQRFPTGELLSVLALYRFINTLAEVAGAGLVTLDDRR